MPKKLTQKEFVERAESLSPNLDFSKSIYKNSTTPVIVVCKKHDLEFMMRPGKILQSQNGCPDCGGKRLTTEDFIRRSIKIHGEDKFDFSETVYTKMNEKIKIKCVEHDVYFFQNPQAFMKGLNGCANCNGQSAFTLKLLKEKAVEKGIFEKFDYSLIRNEDVKNKHSKVKIRCIDHDEVFEQEINSHLYLAKSCPQCNRFSSRVGQKLQKMKSLVNSENKYDYSETDFSLQYPKKATIICKIHKNRFKQTINGHLSGREGCRKCDTVGVSKKEKDLANFVKSLGFEVVENDREILDGKEIDVFIPDLNVGIEFNGLYWHSEKFKGRNFHKDKFELAKNKGVRLLQVWEDDWDNKQDVVKSHIKHVLGVSSQRVFARNTFVKVIEKFDASRFLDSYHIQGFVGSSVYLGLFDKLSNKLVAVAAFVKNKNDYTLTRYATSVHVVGGHSKLVKYFDNNFEFERLVTFADLSFSDGGLYENTGWNVDGFVPPDYSYVIGNKRFHKFGFRLSKFKNDPFLIFEDGLSERELAELNGFDRVWDSGKIRFVKYKPHS